MKEVQLKLQHYNKIESRLGKPLGKAAWKSRLEKPVSLATYLSQGDRKEKRL